MILDINCFIGHWPFRRIPYRTVGDVEELMSRTGTTGALVTPLAGLFYKDSLSAVREMIDQLESESCPDLRPVAVVNPVFPGWREDLLTMIDEWGCVAVRLFPNYHQYRLTDPQAREMLQMVQDRGLPLMVSVRVEDERLHHGLARVKPVPQLDVIWLLRAFPDVKLVLCDLSPGEIDQLGDDIVNHPHALVDTSARMPQFYLEDMVECLSSERIMYGTAMPLKYPECALSQVNDAYLSAEVKRRILCENAREMFGLRMEPNGVGQ